MPKLEMVNKYQVMPYENAILSFVLPKAMFIF